ncbi:MAG TPA: hypothetical protein VFZ24_12400 [Longimicrobiales bacterium]
MSRTARDLPHASLIRLLLCADEHGKGRARLRFADRKHGIGQQPLHDPTGVRSVAAQISKRIGRRAAAGAHDHGCGNRVVDGR